MSSSFSLKHLFVSLPLPMYPFADVARAVAQRHAVRLAGAEETNRVHVYERHLFEVEDHLRSTSSHLLTQLLEVFRPELADQAQRGDSGGEPFLEFQCHRSVFSLGEQLQ